MAYWSDSGVRATSFAGGSGTSSSPYLISTPAQLGYLCYLINSSTSSSYKSKYYKLTADLNMNANYGYLLDMHLPAMHLLVILMVMGILYLT